jgi:hypothetical protein
MLRQDCAREDACLNDQELFTLQPNFGQSQLWLKVNIVKSVFECSAEMRVLKTWPGSTPVEAQIDPLQGRIGPDGRVGSVR